MYDSMSTIDKQIQRLTDDTIAGLSLKQKSLPSQWLYDDVGSQLFEEINTRKLVISSSLAYKKILNRRVYLVYMVYI